MDVETSDGEALNHIRALPVWRGAVELEPLIGGLCNKNFIARDSLGKYVVRLGRDIPIHGISQPFVHTAMQAAAKIGVSPGLKFTSPAISVSEFIEGRHLRPDDMHDEAIVTALVERIRQLHGGGEAIGGTLPYFWPFQVVRIYAHYCRENNSRLGAEIDALAEYASSLERLVTPFTPVFTHNDFVPQNVMLDKSGKIFLIDWDYGAYGHPFFDIAALTANTDDGDGAIDEKILNLYAGIPSPALWKQYRLFKLIVNLREMLWGEVQELTSKLDREIVEAGMASLYPDQEQGYSGYTEMNRARFYRNLAEFKECHG